MRLNKTKKAVAVTLATAVALSSMSVGASAVTYDLSNGDVTVDTETGGGTFSYQGEDTTDNRTYVNEDTEDGGKIIIKQDSEEATDNTVTVKEDVTDAEIVVDGVNIDTTETGESAIVVGEGSDVDLTVQDSTIATGKDGIEIGKDLDGSAETEDKKDTSVDLTLDDTTIKVDGEFGIGVDVHDGADVELELSGESTIQGTGDKKTEVDGIRVGGEGAADAAGTTGGTASLTIVGGDADDAQTDAEESGSLTIQDTTTGIMTDKDSTITLDEGADVTVKDTQVSSSSQSGHGVLLHGDMTITGSSSLTVDGVAGTGAYGYGVTTDSDIVVEDDSTLTVKNVTEGYGIYGEGAEAEDEASLKVDGGTLNISDVKTGVAFESGAKDIIFAKSDVNIEADNIGITVGDSSDITFDGADATITTTGKTNSDAAIYNEAASDKSIVIKGESNVALDSGVGIRTSMKDVTIDGKSTVNINTTYYGMHLNKNATAFNLQGESVCNITGESYVAGVRATKKGNVLQVKENSLLNVSAGAASYGIYFNTNGKLTVDNATVLVKGAYGLGGIQAYGKNGVITILDGSHVETTSITKNSNPKATGNKLVVTGGTLTYDYSVDNSLWPVNEQGDVLTNFLLTTDEEHASFDTLSYNGETYSYLSDLTKETKQHMSVWVPAAELDYMLDTNGDPSILGKTLQELTEAGYTFDTAYKTDASGEKVIVLRDLVVNGQSLNFTKTTDENGNTKLIYGTEEKQSDGAPSAYDMVYGTTYELDGKQYVIVWGYEPAAGDALNLFTADTAVSVTGENHTVKVYGALQEIVEPDEDTEIVIPPAVVVTPPVQDATPDIDVPVAETVVTPEEPELPAVQDATPDAVAAALPQTGVNWLSMAVLAISGLSMMAAGAFISLFRKDN